MLLTDELYSKGASRKEIFTPINDQYCLVTKRMPAEDQNLENYLNNIHEAVASGINLTDILDYRLIPGTTSYYDNNKISYTRGVYLEQRAQGSCIAEIKMPSFELATDNAHKITEDYILALTKYIDELESISKYKQEVFNKLIKDCIDIERYNLSIDPKPNNFFHNENGYTIIDVIPQSRPDKNKKYLASYAFVIVYGYGLAHLYLPDDYNQYITQPLAERLTNYYSIINARIVSALRNNNIPEEAIKEILGERIESQNKLTIVPSQSDIEQIITNAKSKLNTVPRSKHSSLTIKV